MPGGPSGAWAKGRVWTLSMRVTSTCPNDVVFSTEGGGGSLRVTVPALAEEVTVD